MNSSRSNSSEKSMEPAERMRQLSEKASVKVEKSIPALMYYNSGKQMKRMADIYLREGSLDLAYILYLKYIELFLEKIREHPEFLSVPEDEKKIAKENIKGMLLKAEDLKKSLLQKYADEFKRWKKEQQVNENARREQLERDKQRSNSPSITLSTLERDSRLITDSSNSTIIPEGLRPILLPSTLISKFLQLAEGNTSKNIETCALLTGTLQQDRLIVTVLLIPQQHGTADDCTADNDLATFNVIESRSLITLGWIHTHPSQDAFLSSVDLHSQFGYQAMLPEAIAIVCSPRHSNEIFRLSDRGLEIIRNCSSTGFHPHPGPSSIYEKASHVQMVDMPLEIVDLRQLTSSNRSRTLWWLCFFYVASLIDVFLPCLRCSSLNRSKTDSKSAKRR